MNLGTKVLYIFAIAVLVAGTYIVLLAMQPATNIIVATANASGNWTNSPESQAVILSYPLWQWALPGLIGMIAIVGIWLKK